MNHGPTWLRSCSYCRHNSVCGERELRGERRGKGGRTWFTTAASSFFMCLMLPAGAATGQSWSIEPRLGVVVSSGLYEDAAITGLEPVTVSPGVALEGALLVRTVLSPLWALEAELSYATGSLTATDGEDERRLSDLRVIGGSVRVRRALRRLQAVVGIGGLSYDAPDAQAYEEGASVFPAAIVGIAAPFAAAGRRIRLEATARIHRHQTPVLERAGADAALVVRGGLQIGIEFGGGR